MTSSDLPFSSDQCTFRISCYFSYPSAGSVPSMPLLLWSHLCGQHTYILLWPSHLSFHCLYISLLSQQVFVQPCQFPSSSTWFLMLGDRELLCFQKVFPKSCQLCSIPISLRTASQGIPSSNLFKRWKFTFLNFSVLTLLFSRPISFGYLI